MYCILFLHQTTTLRASACSSLSCIASSFYIKPQPRYGRIGAGSSCIASSFYIKPQLRILAFDVEGGLYCILFLHQTTTTCYHKTISNRCIASSFYIKPQQNGRKIISRMCCIASSFYIKPQHNSGNGFRNYVVLHPLSTSNHNFCRTRNCLSSLYCILFLHQTTTVSP